jgi:predicted amidohydrolase YtcJ
MLRAIALWLLLALVPGAAAQETVVYSNANVYTMTPGRPQVQAIATRGEFIVAVGAVEDVRAAAGEGAREIDLGGMTVLPGLIDAHGHMASLGAFGLGFLDLSAAADFGGVVRAAAVAAAERKPGEWVLGGRWDHESWPGRALPAHAALSEATPENPVWLRRVDGHAGIANAAAMRLARITRDTPSPEGGEILKDEAGEPTGVLVDNAMALVESMVPAGARGRGEDLLLKAQELCLSAGLTGVHDAGVSPADVAVYERLAGEGELKLRCYLMVSGHHAMRWFEERPAFSGPVVTVRAAKVYMDGAMGSRGAWLLEPYADRPVDAGGQPYTGLAVSKTDFVEAVARHAVEKGYQVCTHAIGDRANREVLDAYERATRIVGIPPARMNYRFRIEHAQLLNLDDIPRFAELGVIASMQPTHCTSDMRWVEDRVGAERARGAYAWQNLLMLGAVIAGGSDFPVESHNPFLGIYAAATRQDLDGKPEGGWMPRECMTREQALHAFTMGAAYAAFEEGTKGSLEAGKLADFIVIDRDIMTCPARDIADTRVLRTVIGGETVYERAE